jgi:hypothetical protein
MSKAKSNDSEEAHVSDSFDLVLPSTLARSDNCNLVIQIDPRQAKLLDLEGSVGAIGRFESSSEGILLDCKGFQYHGKIHPGPTIMAISHSGDGVLKVEGITNEFVTLSQVSDVMQKLNAVVVKGAMTEEFEVVDENENVNMKMDDDQKGDKSLQQSSNLKSKKKRASLTTSKRSKKKRK